MPKRVPAADGDRRPPSIGWLAARPGVTVFAIALLARAAWVVQLPNTLAWVDEQQFAAIARDLVAGAGYTGSTYRGNPVLPFFLAGFFALFGEAYVWPRLAQAVVGAATCVLVQRLARRVSGESAGLIAGLLAAVYPAHIYLAGVFYVDALFTFCLVASVLLVMRARDETPGLQPALVAGAVLGLGVLTRAVLVVFVPVALAFVVGRRASRSGVLRGLALATAFAVTVLPWTVRNYVVHHRVILVSSGFASKLWEGNNELARGDADDRDIRWTTPIWRERLAELPPEERSRVTAFYDQVDRRLAERLARNDDFFLAADDVLGPVALRYMVEHPGRTAALFLAKVQTLYSAFSDTLTSHPDASPRNRRVAALSYYPVLVLAAAGAIMAVARGRRVGPILGAVVAISATFGLLNACARFRMPLDPLLIVLAAAPVAAAWSWLSRAATSVAAARRMQHA